MSSGNGTQRRRLANKRELMAHFEISKPTLESWLRRGLPVVKRGSETVPWEFDLDECERWRNERRAVSSQHWAGADDRSASVYKQSRMAREVIAAKLAALEYERVAARYVSVAEVKAEEFKQARRIRAAFLALPARVAPLARGVESDHAARELMTAEIIPVLEELTE